MISEADFDAAIRSAAVVLVGPGSLAVTLRFNESRMDTPVVSARTYGAAAVYMERLAKGAGVCVVEADLARRLAAVTVGQKIPSWLYGPVAEVLALVQSYCRNRSAGKSAQSAGEEKERGNPESERKQP